MIPLKATDGLVGVSTAAAVNKELHPSGRGFRAEAFSPQPGPSNQLVFFDDTFNGNVSD